MNESFDPFGGGNTSALPTGNGWGGGADNSFAGTQAAPKGNDYDRVAIPVTVATLNNLQSNDEKIQFGNFSFSQVRVIGELVSVSETETKETHYMIRDVGNTDQQPFMVVQYFGIDGNASPFIEGTILHAIGKIRTFDNQSAILAFKVQEVTEPHMAEVFPKEARVAELFFTKNVPDLYGAGDIANFVGTFLSTEPPQSNTRSNAPAALVTPSRKPAFNNFSDAGTPNDMNGSNIYGSTQRQGRGSNVQQNKILEYFARNDVSSEEGHNMATIRNAINGNARFEEDINALAQNGVIYTTIDDNHYALVTE